MATPRQDLGAHGEQLVVKNCTCPRCKQSRTLVRLPTNFKCADIICEFCGYLAQVKAARVSNISAPQVRILGAAWGPQKERIDASIYIPLYVVLFQGTEFSIFYLPADLQRPDMFVPRAPLSTKARRAGWQGFIYNLSAVRDYMVRLK